MVTIEQKLSLFSNLLHRTMDEAFKLEMEKLRKEYEVKMQKDKEAVDKEAESIINSARKRAEAERTEKVSRSKVELKKEYMSLKERYFSVLMERIVREIGLFTASERYPEYILGLARKLEPLAQTSGKLEIYLNGRDSEKYPDTIRQALAKHAELVFKPADEDIIGGFIADDTQNNVRIDMSLKALLDDNKSYIMQTLFQAIEMGE